MARERKRRGGLGRLRRRCAIISFLDNHGSRFNLWEWMRERVEEYKMPGVEFGGMRVVPVRKDTVNWVLDRRMLLAPINPSAENVLRSLAREIWAKLKKERDLEKGVGRCWQICDLRRELWFWV